MESPTPVSRYIRQNSKKRVFPAGGSSSACKEVEVLEIPPPINRTPKPKSSSKQKEIICQEIIDVDMDEDSDDVMLTDGEADPRGKGKEALANSSAGFSGFATGESGSDTSVSNNGNADLHDSTNPDDFSSNLFYGEDEWIDTYYDDILFDDYSMLESQFDHMDIPPGVEAPFPWFPSSPGHDSKAYMSSTSTNAGSQLQPDGIKHVPSPMDLAPPPPPPSLPQSSFSSKYFSGNNLSSRSKSIPPTQLNVYNPHGKGKLVSGPTDHSLGLKKQTVSSSAGSHSSKSSFAHKYGKDVLQSLSKSKRKSRALAFYSQYPSVTSHAINANGGGSHPTLSIPTNAPPGLGNYMPAWHDLPLNVLDPSLGPVGFMPGNAFTSWAQGPASDQNVASSRDTSVSHTAEMRNVDEILRNFDSIKRFDTVEDFSDHHYSKNGSSAKQPPKNWSKKIQEEWKILEKDLPDKIFVRVYDSRMDLLRAVIIGAEGTPYHDGLFYFDVYFPSSYPNVPPQVHYHSGGLRINPNLYNCGKVCLSLLNTWTGSHKEKWIPGTSTMLQVLVSIQGLILNAKPYFNEPGYANMSGSPSGEKKSLEYNERTFMYSLQTMVYNMRRPPKHFEDFTIGYFCKHARDILLSCKAYLEGVQVGCLVKGGVQDVDASDNSCSQHFKTNLAGFIPVLVKTFTQIGAKDCEEFLSLAPKENEAAANSSRVRNYNLHY